MKRLVLQCAGAASLALLAGCVAVPTIDQAKLKPPKTVLIADIPDIKPAANIGMVWSSLPEWYFSSSFDHLFVIRRDAEAVPGVAELGAGQAEVENYVAAAAVSATHQLNSMPPSSTPGANLASMGVALLIGAMIESSAKETQLKAVEFPGLVQKVTPGIDLRKDFMQALTHSLEARGVQVRIMGQTRTHMPRLFWPAKDEEGKALSVGPFAKSPPVDADLLVQVVPTASYAAPGPLNNYARQVGVGLALFEGRTRKFIGWQAVQLKKDNRFEYARYDNLAADVANAGPELHRALMSLAPEVAAIISGNNKPEAAGHVPTREATQAPAGRHPPAAPAAPLAPPAATPAAAAVGPVPVAAGNATVPLPAAGPAPLAPAPAVAAPKAPAPAPVAATSAPPPVTATTIPVAAAAAPAGKKETRLQWLKQMHDAKLISTSEYEAKRQQVLAAP